MHVKVQSLILKRVQNDVLVMLNLSRHLVGILDLIRPERAPEAPPCGRGALN
jgi:hypothetical protein